MIVVDDPGSSFGHCLRIDTRQQLGLKTSNNRCRHWTLTRLAALLKLGDVAPNMVSASELLDLETRLDIYIREPDEHSQSYSSRLHLTPSIHPTNPNHDIHIHSHINNKQWAG